MAFLLLPRFTSVFRKKKLLGNRFAHVETHLLVRFSVWLTAYWLETARCCQIMGKSALGILVISVRPAGFYFQRQVDLRNKVQLTKLGNILHDLRWVALTLLLSWSAHISLAWEFSGLSCASGVRPFSGAAKKNFWGYDFGVATLWCGPCCARCLKLDSNVHPTGCKT